MLITTGLYKMCDERDDSFLPDHSIQWTNRVNGFFVAASELCEANVKQAKISSITRDDREFVQEIYGHYGNLFTCLTKNYNNQRHKIRVGASFLVITLVEQKTY